MISEADLQEIRAADREINRKTRKRRTPTEAQRERARQTTRNWRTKNPDRVQEYNRSYQKQNRAAINAAQRTRYRKACEKAVPNEEITLWRQGLGLKQCEAAVRIGVSAASLSNWERGIFPAPAWAMERIRSDRVEVHHEKDGAEVL